MNIFDHSMAIIDLMRFGIEVYTSKDCLDSLGFNRPFMYPVEPNKSFKIGDLDIIAFDLEHDVRNFGYLIADPDGNKLLFATDTYFIRQQFKGLTHVMIEANYAKEFIHPDTDPAIVNRIYKSHMSLDTVKGFFRSTDISRLQEVYLLHLSDSRSDAEYFKTEIAKITGCPVYVA